MNLIEFIRDADSEANRKHLYALVSAFLTLIIGLFVAARASSAAERITRFDAQQKLLARKFTYYALVTLTIASALNQIGFDLKVLLGAAGVLTVAIGFAAQTSASNLISGLFLMVERPFVVGQVVQVGEITGEVISIDLLSCRIRTLDNRMARIPNESMVKSNIYNLSHYPIRRVDLNLSLAYVSSVADARTALLRAADRNPLILDEPKPVFIFQSFADSQLNVQLQTWTIRENIVAAQNALYEAVKDELAQANVAIAPMRARI